MNPVRPVRWRRRLGVADAAGALSCLLGAIGLVRLPDLPARLQAATKPQTLGLLLILLGTALRVELASAVTLVLVGAVPGDHRAGDLAAGRAGRPTAAERCRTTRWSSTSWPSTSPRTRWWVTSRTATTATTATDRPPSHPERAVARRVGLSHASQQVREHRRGCVTAGSGGSCVRGGGLGSPARPRRAVREPCAGHTGRTEGGRKAVVGGRRGRLGPGAGAGRAGDRGDGRVPARRARRRPPLPAGRRERAARVHAAVRRGPRAGRRARTRTRRPGTPSGCRSRWRRDPADPALAGQHLPRVQQRPRPPRAVDRRPDAVGRAAGCCCSTGC